MASATASHRAVCAGLSCGIGIAVPVVAWAATLPFGSVSDSVAANALPFAAGAVAGVGLFAVAQAVSDRETDTDFQAHRAAAREERRAQREERRQEYVNFFNHDDDAPVIQRAQVSASDKAAWDALTDDTFVACTPASSRDVYQVAIDELSQVAQTGSVNRDDIAAAARAAAGSNAVPAGTTAQFIALASVASAAAANAAYGAGDGVAAAGDEDDAAAARAAALASLGVSNNGIVKDAIPTIRAFDGEPTGHVVSVLSQAAHPVHNTASMESKGGQSVASVAARAPFSSAVVDVLDDSDEIEVPVADYTGHEDMWASALAILADEDAVSIPVPKAEPAAASGQTPAYIAAHSKPPASGITQPIAKINADRAQAVVENARATQVHDRINRIIEEETGRLGSQDTRTRSREYLKVIQGGTMAMPRLQAEA